MKSQAEMDQDYQALLDLLPPFIVECAQKKSILKRNSNLERLAHDNDIPIYVIKSSTTSHLTKFLLYILKMEEPSESRELAKLDALML